MVKNNQRKHIYVYADWIGIEGPQLMGNLFVDIVRGEEIFSFLYDNHWITQGFAQNLDPDLQLYSGAQHLEKENQILEFSPILALIVGEDFSCKEEKPFFPSKKCELQKNYMRAITY